MPRGSPPPRTQSSPALAIAEQARRDAAFNADRQWFKAGPDRSFRARLATAQEIEDLRSGGAVQWGWIITGGRSGDLLSFCFPLIKSEA